MNFLIQSIIKSNKLKSQKLNWFNFEMKTNQRKYQTFQILNQIIEASQTFWIL